jgi:acetyl esterase/lipase
MLHGQGSTRFAFADLAGALANRGVVVLAADWLANPSQALLSASDAVCAVAYANQHAEDWGTDPQRIIVAGHSAGGLVAMLAALAPAEFVGCDSAADADVWAYVGLAAAPGAASEGGGLAEQIPDQADVLTLMNTYNYLGNNLDLIVRFVHGIQDPEVRIDRVQAFHSAMTSAGYDTQLIEVDNAGHFAPMSSASPATIATFDELIRQSR